jgi:SAM-dependent methyltransferase
MSKPVSHACPLCHSDRVRPIAHAHDRDYFDCEACRLIHLAPGQRPHAAAERERYQQHENRSDDPDYRAFLSRLADPLVERLPAGAVGLDYGAGPGPTLSRMLEERGFRMEIYDPFFAPDPDALTRSYDFITCSETAEHFFRPSQELRRLGELLRPGGWLGIMTQMFDDSEPFEEWWYARDPTHVCFYRQETMEWIARRFRWALERPAPNVALFRKGQ